MQIDNQIRAGSTQSVRGSQLQTAKKAKARLAQTCSFIPSYFDWKVQRSCWSKGTLLECAELIYVKTTEADRVCEELCQLIREIVSLGGFHIGRLRLPILKIE